MRDRNSLIIIKEGRADVFAEVLKFLDGWCAKNGEKAFVRNTPDGYEVFKEDIKPEPESKPTP